MIDDGRKIRRYANFTPNHTRNNAKMKSITDEYCLCEMKIDIVEIAKGMASAIPFGLGTIWN